MNNISITKISTTELICGNTLEELKKIENSSIDLIVTSPPYNIGKDYEIKKSLENYLKEQEKVILELFRVLKNSGNVCWQVGNYVDKGEIYPLDIFYYNIFKEIGFQLRNRIIWHFGHGLHCSKRFSGRYETILWFSKTDKYVFNLDDVRIPSKYPNKKSFKGQNKGKLSGNPLGKNPEDVWEVLKNDWEKEIWDIPNVKSNHVEKLDHPCQFPVELVERCVLALSNEDGLILDPYVGVGSTIIGALKNNRNVIGIDKERNYINICKQRIDSLQSGFLKTRPMTQKIFDPKKGS